MLLVFPLPRACFILSHRASPFADDRRRSHESFLGVRHRQRASAAQREIVTQESVASPGTSGAKRARGRSRRKSRPWPRRLLAWFLAIAVALPVALVVLFRFLPVPATPLMIATWFREGGIVQNWVPLEAISPNLVRAVIASEDQKFCSHHAFDFE